MYKKISQKGGLTNKKYINKNDYDSIQDKSNYHEIKTNDLKYNLLKHLIEFIENNNNFLNNDSVYIIMPFNINIYNIKKIGFNKLLEQLNNNTINIYLFKQNIIDYEMHNILFEHLHTEKTNENLINLYFYLKKRHYDKIDCSEFKTICDNYILFDITNKKYNLIFNLMNIIDNKILYNEIKQDEVFYLNKNILDINFKPTY